jgi:hypothetical protein
MKRKLVALFCLISMIFHSFSFVSAIFFEDLRVPSIVLKAEKNF